MSAGVAEQRPRPRGRPRSARAHRAILEAAIALFVEQGYEAMSIEGVAARAGVGKTTIYRRWSSKEDLVVDAIEEVLLEVEVVDTGSLRDDLVRILVQMQTTLASSRAGEAFPRMVAEIASASPLGRRYLERVVAQRLVMLGAILSGGAERGELPAGADLDVARGMLVGPLILWRLIGRLSAEGVQGRAEAIVDTVLAGLRSAAGQPLLERHPGGQG